MPTPVVFSWSAGKDSAYALWTLRQDPTYEVRALLTTLTEGYDRVSISGVRRQLVELQAQALGLPLLEVWIPPGCENAVYEERLARALAAESLRGVQHVAFGDLNLADVRAHREARLAELGKTGLFPLWGRETATLARGLIASGFRALLVCVDPLVLAPSFAGRDFDERLLADLPPAIDPCGERGEFHTLVWGGPVFQAAIPCQLGDVVTRDGFVFCDVLVGGASRFP
ncbi:MAG TPA: ATP-binding protein [Candidatus Dormibacteraeota bacterium]